MFCRITQWRIEKEIDDFGRIQHPGTLRHLEGCSSCQGWLQSLKQIGRHLQTDSLGVSDEHLKQVQALVLQHLSHETEGHIAAAGHTTVKPHRFRIAMSAAAAVIVIAIGLFILFSPESDNRDPIEIPNPVALFSEQLQFQIPVLASRPEQLLESEMRNMETGVRHAIGFIQNCLPQGLVAANFSPKKIDSM